MEEMVCDDKRGESDSIPGLFDTAAKKNNKINKSTSENEIR